MYCNDTVVGQEYSGIVSWFTCGFDVAPSKTITAIPKHAAMPNHRGPLSDTGCNGCRILHDRRWRSDLVISRLPRARRRRGDHGRGRAGLPRRSGRRACLQRPELLFKLPIAILQLFILAGELPQLIFKPLDLHFRIDVVGLRRSRHGQRHHRRNCRGAYEKMNSG